VFNFVFNFLKGIFKFTKKTVAKKERKRQLNIKRILLEMRFIDF